MRHFTFRIHCNDDNGLALIFVGWMYDTGAGRTARTFVTIAAPVIDLGRRCYYWCSMHTEWGRRSHINSPRSCAILLSEYTATLINNGLCIDLRWLNIWYGCHIDTEQTARAFVAIATRVCDWPYSKLLLLVFDRCNIGPHVILPH